MRWFSLQILSETFLILRRIHGDISINFLNVFKKLDFFRKVFEKKFSNIKFHENPSLGSGDVACGGTDRRMGRRT